MAPTLFARILRDICDLLKYVQKGSIKDKICILKIQDTSVLKGEHKEPPLFAFPSLHNSERKKKSYKLLDFCCKTVCPKSTRLKKFLWFLGKTGHVFQKLRNCFWILKLVEYPRQFKNKNRPINFRDIAFPKKHLAGSKNFVFYFPKIFGNLPWNQGGYTMLPGVYLITG